MWSFPSTSQSEATNVTPLPNYPDFFRTHAIVNAAKNVFQKIKDTPFFRRLPSIYVPYEEWRSLYMNNDLSNMASSSEGGSKYSSVLYDYEFVGIRRVGPRNDFLALESFDSTTTYSYCRGFESGDVLGDRVAADGNQRGETGNPEVSYAVPKTEATTNPVNARESITFPCLGETRIESGEAPVNKEISPQAEKEKISGQKYDRDTLELRRGNHVTEDGRILPLTSQQDKDMPTGEITSNPDLQKNRSPGSTIETKSKEKLGDHKKDSGGKNANRERQMEVIFHYVEEEHFVTTPSSSSRKNSSERGFLGLGRKHKRRRIPLAKVSFRGMLYRQYHKVKRLMETNVM